MPLLIDGYNLMYAAGITADIPASSRRRGSLERSRMALVEFIAAQLDLAERRTTTIVFDAAGAPPGLPHTLHHEELTIRFAKGYSNADELLEDLIDEHNDPRRLTVVSSDHRVQRAAKRRKAAAVDSDVWYEQIRQRRREAARRERAQLDEAKPSPPVGDAEVAFWLNRVLDDRPARPDDAWPDLFPPGFADDVVDKDADEDS